MWKPPTWVEIRPVPSDAVSMIADDLDLGERAAIALAETMHVDLLLIDEAAGRAEVIVLTRAFMARKGVPGDTALHTTLRLAPSRLVAKGRREQVEAAELEQVEQAERQVAHPLAADAPTSSTRVHAAR